MGQTTHSVNLTPSSPTSPVYSWSVSGIATPVGASNTPTFTVDWGNGTGTYTVNCTVTTNCNGQTQTATTSRTYTIVWNLLLCSDGSNATFQVNDTNLNTGVVIKDDTSGICYTVANNGHIVGPLIGAHSEYSDCASCFNVPACSSITSITIN